MRMVVLAVVFTTLMVYGEKPKPKTDAHGHDAADAIQQTDGAAGRTVIVVNQQTPQGQQEDHPSKPPNDFSRLFSSENLPNIALVIVAAITGWFIAQQAKETAKATQAMRDS